jgi:hypothetical protein
VEGGFRLWRRVEIIKPYPFHSITWKFLRGKQGTSKEKERAWEAHQGGDKDSGNLLLWLRLDKLKNKFAISNETQFLTGQALYGIRILLQATDFLIEMVVFPLQNLIFL